MYTYDTYMFKLETGCLKAGRGEEKQDFVTPYLIFVVIYLEKKPHIRQKYDINHKLSQI